MKLTEKDVQALAQIASHLKDEEGKSHKGYYSGGWAGKQLASIIERNQQAEDMTLYNGDLLAKLAKRHSNGETLTDSEIRVLIAHFQFLRDYLIGVGEHFTSYYYSGAIVSLQYNLEERAKAKS